MALPHGEKADVYSWALLAWAVASGSTPFEGIGRSAFYARVVVGFLLFWFPGWWRFLVGNRLQEAFLGRYLSLYHVVLALCAACPR